MVKRKDNTQRIRVGIAIAAGVIAVAIAAFGLLYGGGTASYRTLDVADGTGPVRIVEYFSYACPHCRSLERVMEGWPESLPEGVVFERAHVAYSPSLRLLARAYLALRRHDALAQNHERIFRAIHDRNREFRSVEALADFVQGRGVEREAILATMRSPRIARQMQATEKRFAELGLLAVPALVVDDKYVINMDSGRRQALDAAASLAAKLLAERGAATETGTAEQP